VTVRLSVDGDIATITLDNPAKRNAMTPAMWRQLRNTIENLPLVRAAVLTGADGSFCAGADISSLTEIGAVPHHPPSPTSTTLPTGNVGHSGAPAGVMPNLAVAAEEALAACPVPVIAAIEGDCIGGGCQLALACDLRIAARGSRFGITPARLGVVYPPQSLARLAHVAGVNTAQWLLLTGDLIDAGQALAMGLVHEVVPAADLPARVAALAATLASRSLLTQAATKDMLAHLATAPGPADRGAYWMAQALESGEAAEGAAAFLARRPPNFPWRPAP
jgi:enoyl-CoA hydratase/carnithine racemase